MDIEETRHILSILMESPLYLNLSLEERHSLLERLAKSYPAVFKRMRIDDIEGSPAEDERGWSGIL